MKDNNIGQFLFTSPFGLFALIADPKVEVVTETINSKEKIKPRWSMFNLAKMITTQNIHYNYKKFNRLPECRFREAN